MDPRSELVLLLEEKTRSHFERRKRRLEQIPWSVRRSALEKAWKSRHWWEKPAEERERFTRDEWIVLHLGWIPEEREQLIQFFESRGHHKRCSHCGRGLVATGPYSHSPACGSASEPQQ